MEAYRPPLHQVLLVLNVLQFGLQRLELFLQLRVPFAFFECVLVKLVRDLY